MIECFDVDTYQRDGGLVTTENIKKYIKEGNQGKESIIQAIKLLKKTHKEMEYLPINELAIILTSEIDKRMPKKCSECNEYYSDKLTENQKLQCITCNIGHHGCNKESQGMKIKGCKWMCGDCETLIKENDDLLNSLRLLVSLAAINNKQEHCKKSKKRKRIPECLKEKNKTTYSCGECKKTINPRSPSIGCTGCTDWLHIKCAGFKSTKEAVKDQDIFECNRCQKMKEDDRNHSVNNDNDIDVIEDVNDTATLKNDIGASIPQNGNKTKFDFSKRNEEATLIKGDKNSTITQNNNNNSNKDSWRLEQLKSELQSFSLKTWLLDSHVYYLLKNLQKEASKKGSQIWFVDPTIVQFLKYTSNENVESTLDAEDAWWKDYIFMPINDCGPNDEVEGGIHWSLLVFSRKENTWYYMDSAQQANRKVAETLVNKLNKYMFNFSDSSPCFVVSKCTKQKNNYDCGAFVMLFAQTASRRIFNCEPLDTCLIDEGEVKTLRKWIRNQMEKELQQLDAGRNILNKNSIEVRPVNKTKLNSVPLNNGTKGPQGNQHTYSHKMDKVCWKWVNNKCWRGENCKFKHPKICTEILNNRQCKSEQCNQYHPQLCRANKNQERCKWGENCKFRHVNDNLYHRGYQQKHVNTVNYNTNNKKTYDNYKNWSYENDYNLPGGYNRGHNRNYRGMENFHKEWPTPWEGKMLKRLRQMVNMEQNSWEPLGW